MKIAVIVQARLSSTRLPGKVLLPLNGVTVLDHVLARCWRIRQTPTVVCAIADEPGHGAIADIALASAAQVVVGPVDDVLERYRLAAEQVDAELIVRVTADCPLIDPAVIGDLIDFYGRMDNDYISNIGVRTFPHGVDCEVFSRSCLDWAAREATDPQDREHVTPFMRRHQNADKVTMRSKREDMKHRRWTLDYPEDYAMLTAMFLRVPQISPALGYWELSKILDCVPEIEAINANRRIY